MPTKERNIVKPPNEGLFKTNDKANGYMPLAGGASTTHPPNQHLRDGDPGSSANLARQASTVRPPNEALKDGDPGFSMPWTPPGVVEPGKGAVPVNPFTPGGPGLSRSMPVSDMGIAKK